MERTKPGSHCESHSATSDAISTVATRHTHYKPFPLFDRTRTCCVESADSGPASCCPIWTLIESIQIGCLFEEGRRKIRDICARLRRCQAQRLHQLLATHSVDLLRSSPERTVSGLSIVVVSNSVIVRVAVCEIVSHDVVLASEIWNLHLKQPRVRNIRPCAMCSSVPDQVTMCL